MRFLHLLHLNSPDAPLISLGAPGLWKFSMDYVPTTPAVFVNLYNNMWNTNFPLWQDGSWTESVRLWPIVEDSPTVANLSKKGWETRLPLLTVVAEGKAGKLPTSKKGIAVSKSGVLVSAYGDNPDGEGTILRLWEYAGISGKCTVNYGTGNHVKAVIPIDQRGTVLGKEMALKDGLFTFNLGKFAPASFLLVY